MLIVIGANPWEAIFGAMWEGAFGSTNALAETLVESNSAVVCRVGHLYRISGQHNQHWRRRPAVVLGAILATLLGLNLPDAPGWLVISMALIAGFVRGCLLGEHPGLSRRSLLT